MKTCESCDKEQSLDQFGEYQNKRKDKTYHRNKCKTCVGIQHSLWAKDHRNQQNVRQRMRKNTLSRVYNITLDEYDIMSEKQKGVCGICDRGPVRQYLSIDHCHISGKVRGLLCESCNLALGKFKDDIKLLERAIEYLRENQA